MDSAEALEVEHVELERMLEVLKVRVSLPSGRWEDVSVPVNGRIFDLKMAAQQSLEQSFLKIAGPDGRLLDPTKSLQSAWLKDGDTIAAVAQQPKIAATSSAFALWCIGGDKVVTWGSSFHGGDISALDVGFSLLSCQSQSSP